MKARIIQKKVVCDYCKQEFTIEKITENKLTENGVKIRELYFICPHCNTRFDIGKYDMRTNKKLKGR